MIQIISIREPESSEEMKAYYELRWQVLRQPWGQPRGSECDELEELSQHVAAFDQQGRLIGTGRLHVDSDHGGQIRYIAVAEDARRAGVGRAIVVRIEELAQELGLRRLRLHSRETAVGFYERLGYRVVGPAPTLYEEIKHSSMEKLLRG